MKQLKSTPKLVAAVQEAARKELHTSESSWSKERVTSIDGKTIPQAVAFMLHVLADHASPVQTSAMHAVFKVWSDAHAAEIAKLADRNGGSQMLQLGVFSIIERSHVNAFISNRTRPSKAPLTMSLAEAAAKVKKAEETEPKPKQEDFKRSTAKRSPTTTISCLQCSELSNKAAKSVHPVQRQTPPLRAVVVLQKLVSEGKAVETVAETGIDYQTVLAGVQEGRMFIAGINESSGLCTRYADTTLRVQMSGTLAVPGLEKCVDNTRFVHELRTSFVSLPDPNELTRHGVHSLSVVGMGTYNVVAAALNSNKLPPLLQNQNFVLRIPRPDTKGIAINEACKELHAMLVAAYGGYGPRVLWSYVHISTLNTVSGESCRLFVALERLPGSLQATVHQRDFEASRTMKLLFDTVFDFSIRNVIALDAKLDNFLVRCQTSTVTDVVAIDFDPQLFRQLDPTTDPRVALAFNLVYMGVTLRTYSSHSAWTAWCAQPVGSETMHSFVTALVRGLNGHEHPVAAAVWCEDTLGSFQFRDQPGNAYTAEDAIGIVLYYFVKTSFTEGLKVARKIKSGSRDGVSHFQKMLGPMMRYLVQKLAHRQRLLDVLLDCWTVTLVPFPPGDRNDSSAQLCGDVEQPLVHEMLDRVEQK